LVKEGTMERLDYSDDSIVAMLKRDMKGVPITEWQHTYNSSWTSILFLEWTIFLPHTKC